MTIVYHLLNGGAAHAGGSGIYTLADTVAAAKAAAGVNDVKETVVQSQRGLGQYVTFGILVDETLGVAVDP